jgi:hypothetical protein
MENQKVHLLKWCPSGKIGGVYSDYNQAYQIAERYNKSVPWWRKWTDAINGNVSKWIVQTFDVK